MPLEQPQAIRTIFFDAGFTLLQPSSSILEICQRVCQQLDLHIQVDDMEQHLEAAEDHFFRHMRLHREVWASEQTINEFWLSYYTILLRPLLKEHDEPRLYQLAKAINEEFDKHSSWSTFPDVLPTLEALRHHNYTLGIISDWGISLGSILRDLDLIQYFDCVIISAAAGYGKPSPLLYEEALKRANAIADYTVHIGDTYISDVLGARAVGITPVLLDRGRKLSEQNVDCLLAHSLYDLLDLLEVPRI
jgi:putative hydrolase of the HAD superfamily